MSFPNTHTPTKAECQGKVVYEVQKYKTDSGSSQYQLRGEIKEKFIELFPTTPNREMMQLFGLSFTTLMRFKNELHLEKDMEVIRHKQAQQSKEICEKNGYYDSLRGKQVSKECRLGHQRYLKSNRFIPPMTRLKRTNPERYAEVRDHVTESVKALWASPNHVHPCKSLTKEKYAQFIEKLSVSHKDIFKKEKRRVELGFHQHTNYYIPSVNYSNKQISYRGRMKAKGYILGIANEAYGERYTIFYDENTERSPKSEAWASHIGMSILPLPNE